MHDFRDPVRNPETSHSNSNASYLLGCTYSSDLNRLPRDVSKVCLPAAPSFVRGAAIALSNLASFAVRLFGWPPLVKSLAQQTSGICV